MCKLGSLREIDVILPIHVLARNIVFFLRRSKDVEVVENEMGVKKRVEERQIGEKNGSC
jgi:hypothetical protein